jgi:hypothetical protein
MLHMDVPVNPLTLCLGIFSFIPFTLLIPLTLLTPCSNMEPKQASILYAKECQLCCSLISNISMLLDLLRILFPLLAKEPKAFYALNPDTSQKGFSWVSCCRESKYIF